MIALSQAPPTWSPRRPSCVSLTVWMKMTHSWPCSRTPDAGGSQLGVNRGRQWVAGWYRTHPFCGPLRAKWQLLGEKDNKADVILKYNADEARSLKAYGELPEHAKINETDTFGPGDDDEIQFDDIGDDDEDIDDI
ncbi:eukaryotic translation initiation factor 1A, X-chromosomal isoform 2-T3 [Vipera latastei]